MEENPSLHKPEATHLMVLRARHHRLTFRRPLIMGILNVNDDSFCDDGSLDPTWASEKMANLLRDGADIIDIGAESARTNRPPITESEEIARLLPAIDAFKQSKIQNPKSKILSVNTWRPAVAAAALAAGADLLNDMGGLPTSENARLCADHGAALLIMHTLGEPKVPQTAATYPAIIETLLDFFERKIQQATEAGLPRNQIILDPGIDFAKQRADNLTIYRHLDKLAALELPILLPVSRKTVIGDVLNQPNPLERDPGTVACIVAGVRRGAHILRVHNVRAAHQTLAAILPATTGASFPVSQ